MVEEVNNPDAGVFPHRLKNSGASRLPLRTPFYPRNDCRGWINRAKREETVSRRLNQMLDDLKANDRHVKRAARARS